MQRQSLQSSSSSSLDFDSRVVNRVLCGWLPPQLVIAARAATAAVALPIDSGTGHRFALAASHHLRKRRNTPRISRPPRRVLEGLEPVRKRLDMYIQCTLAARVCGGCTTWWSMSCTTRSTRRSPARPEATDGRHRNAYNVVCWCAFYENFIYLRSLCNPAGCNLNFYTTHQCATAAASSSTYLSCLSLRQPNELDGDHAGTPGRA